MKIKLRSIVAGPNLRGNPGEVIPIEAAQGKELIAGGYATEVIETAESVPVGETPETTKAPKTPKQPRTAKAE